MNNDLAWAQHGGKSKGRENLIVLDISWHHLLLGLMHKHAVFNPLSIELGRFAVVLNLIRAFNLSCLSTCSLPNMLVSEQPYFFRSVSPTSFTTPPPYFALTVVNITFWIELMVYAQYKRFSLIEVSFPPLRERCPLPSDIHGKLLGL